MLWLGTEGVDGPGTAGDRQRLLPDDDGGLLDPMWVDGKLVFSSDRAASFPDRTREQANLWIYDDAPTGEAEPRQLTFQGEGAGYVRDATTDGTRITWHSRGEIHVLDSLDAEPRRLEVTLPGASAAPLTVSPTQNLDAVVPDHTGDASVVSWRGATFWLTHREGPARALAAVSGVRTREPVLLGRTGGWLWPPMPRARMHWRSSRSTATAGTGGCWAGSWGECSTWPRTRPASAWP
ncbi:hypothetical protein [Nesterenkonia sp. PF2B19]|uniref:hypothetical protein n=1 Tax=Nesterenkonia sp. PF2B19 TaxID=1881858 RepID=UPI001F19AC26|nr:hypothetical protein [Nesterenkonia sp. PF2B19]